MHQNPLGRGGPHTDRENCENECDVNETCGGRRDIHRFLAFFFSAPQCRRCVVDLFWRLVKLRAYVNDNWSIPASTRRESGLRLEPRCIAVYQTADFSSKLKIQYLFMGLQILRLIKFSSRRHSFTPPTGDLWVGKARVHLPYCPSFSRSSSSPSFLARGEISRMKEMSKRKGKKKTEKETTVRNMTGRCQNNSPVVIFVQRSFNMVTEMHMQYSWDRSQELLGWVSCARWWLTGL